MCIQNIASEQFSTETSNHVIISIYNRMQLHGHVFEKYQPVGFLTVGFFFCVSDHIPWEPEVFLACGGNFRCWPKADTSSAVGRSYERRSREKNLWHGAVIFTVPVDLWAFLSDYIYTNQTDSLRLWSCAGLSLRAGSRGFPPATQSMTPGYFRR